MFIFSPRKVGPAMADLGPMAQSVAAALEGVQLLSRDGASVALAMRYAELIDDPQPTATYGEPLRYLRAALRTADKDGHRHLQKIEDALAAHSVASDLGPKLLAALTALNMTPAARAKLTEKVADTAPSPAETKLDELRKRRAARTNSA